MTEKQVKEARKSWHDLSTVCWCRADRLCSTCRQQDAIKKSVEDAGYNLFTGEKTRRQ